MRRLLALLFFCLAIGIAAGSLAKKSLPTSPKPPSKAQPDLLHPIAARGVDEARPPTYRHIQEVLHNSAITLPSDLAKEKQECADAQECGLAQGCVSRTCEACQGDRDCSTHEACAKGSCIPKLAAACRRDDDCAEEAFCFTSEVSAGPRGNTEMFSSCISESGSSEFPPPSPISIEYEFKTSEIANKQAFSETLMKELRQ